jgi:hypothetical protein
VPVAVDREVGGGERTVGPGAQGVNQGRTVGEGEFVLEEKRLDPEGPLVGVAAMKFVTTLERN